MAQKEAKFLEVRTWFIIRSEVASIEDSKFYVVMSPEKTIKFLQDYIKKTYCKSWWHFFSFKDDGALRCFTCHRLKKDKNSEVK